VVNFDSIGEGQVCVYPNLNHYLPWHKRLKVAAKYVLGWDRGDNSDYDSIVLDVDEVRELVEYCSEMLDKLKRDPASKRSVMDLFKDPARNILIRLYCSSDKVKRVAEALPDAIRSEDYAEVRRLAGSLFEIASNLVSDVSKSEIHGSCQFHKRALGL
jgi:hypothetical protein